MSTENSNSSKIFSKLGFWTRGAARADPNLVRPNLSGSTLPPELLGSEESAQLPQLIPSGSYEVPTNKHSEFKGTHSDQEDAVACHPSESGGVDTVGVQRDGTTRRGSSDLAIALKDRTSSGHKEIQELAENYRLRSRSIATKRELHRATDSKERAEVILDHHLKDINSI